MAMYVVDVVVDLHAPKYADKVERVSVTLGLNEADAMFAFHMSWYKIARTLAKLTPWRVTVRDVQFSAEDRDKMIALADAQARADEEDFILREEQPTQAEIDYWDGLVGANVD